MTADKLSRLRALSWRERLLLSQALVLLPVVRIGLRLAGLRRTQRALEAWSHPPRGAGVPASRLAYLVGAVAGNLPITSSCLARSLLLHAMLRREGVESELRIGVRRVGDTVDAHAWVECGGEPVNDAADVPLRYPPFR